MKARIFGQKQLRELIWPGKKAVKSEGGRVTVIGGSDLFHGAPILALKAASRVVDIVFFATPEVNKGVVEKLKSKLAAFIWMPFEEVEAYVAKSDAVLIGPGLMRYRRERADSTSICDPAGKETKMLSEGLWQKFPDKQWVVDGGSLQVVDVNLLPSGAILTPNRREMAMMFGEDIGRGSLEEETEKVRTLAEKHDCVIGYKGVTSIVSDGEESWWIKGGSPGLIKGGTGDVVAGLTVGLAAKNKPILAAAAANYLVKKAGESLEKERGQMFNADDVAERVPLIFGSCLN